MCLKRNKNETFIHIARIVLKSWTAANKDCWTLFSLIRFFLLLLALLMRKLSCWVVQTLRNVLKASGFSAPNNKFSKFNENVSSIIINSHSRGSSFSSERWLSITVKLDNSTWFRWRKIYLPAQLHSLEKVIKDWWFMVLMNPPSHYYAVSMKRRIRSCLAREGF